MGDFRILKKKEPAKPAVPPAPPAPPPAGGNNAPPCCCCANDRNRYPLSRIRSMDYVHHKHYGLNHWDDKGDYYAPPPPRRLYHVPCHQDFRHREPVYALAVAPPQYSYYDMLQPMPYHDQPPSPPWRYAPPPQRRYGPPHNDYFGGRGAPAHDCYYDFFGGCY